MSQIPTSKETAAWLMEECSEVIQELAKFNRFNGKWNEIPPGKTKTRFELLKDEMEDVQRAWESLQTSISLEKWKE